MKKIKLAMVLASTIILVACNNNAALQEMEYAKSEAEHSGMVISQADKEKVYAFVDNLLPCIEEIELANVMIDHTTTQLRDEKVPMYEIKLMYEEASGLYAHALDGLADISLPVLESPELDRLVQDIHVLLIRITDEGELITFHMLDTMDTYDVRGPKKAGAHAETLSMYMSLLNKMFDSLNFKLGLDQEHVDLT